MELICNVSILSGALDQLTTIIHNLLEAGRMGDEPLGVKDLLRRR